jgi:hypothetical protein
MRIYAAQQTDRQTTHDYRGLSLQELISYLGYPSQTKTQRITGKRYYQKRKFNHIHVSKMQ